MTCSNHSYRFHVHALFQTISDAVSQNQAWADCHPLMLWSESWNARGIWLWSSSLSATPMECSLPFQVANSSHALQSPLEDVPWTTITNNLWYIIIQHFSTIPFYQTKCSHIIYKNSAFKPAGSIMEHTKEMTRAFWVHSRRDPLPAPFIIEGVGMKNSQFITKKELVILSHS
jgi:hypothetical protein